MLNEKIKVRVTQTGQTMDVVVFNKRADCIEVVLGEGVKIGAYCVIRNATIAAGARIHEFTHIDGEKAGAKVDVSTEGHCRARHHLHVARGVAHAVDRAAGGRAVACAARAAASKSARGGVSRSKLPRVSRPRTSIAESRTLSCRTCGGM